MSLFVTAFLMGLMGLVHCLTMCGSLSMALTFSIPANKNYRWYALIISIGRIAGYAVVGLVANLFSKSIISITGGNVVYLSIFASLLMIGIALHIANISNMVLSLEKLGKLIDPVIAPLKKRILPIDSITKCLSYGFLWGFLPCGMVYTALTLALVAPSPYLGAATMVAFGLGTLPALIGITLFSQQVSSKLKKTSVRLFFAILIVIMAIIQLVNSIQKLQGAF